MRARKLRGTKSGKSVAARSAGSRHSDGKPNSDTNTSASRTAKASDRCQLSTVEDCCTMERDCVINLGSWRLSEHNLRGIVGDAACRFKPKTDLDAEMGLIYHSPRGGLCRLGMTRSSLLESA
jgi:hypothetical protein